MNEFEMTLKALNDNDYDYSEYEVKSIIAQSKEAKAELISKLRQMPNWDEDAQAVVFRKNIKRSIDTSSCTEVIDWLRTRLKGTFEEVKAGPFSWNELSDIMDSLQLKLSCYRKLMSSNEPVDRERYQNLRIEYDKFDKYYADLDRNTVSVNGKHISTEDYNKLDAFYSSTEALMRLLCNNETVLSSDAAERINKNFPDVKVFEGQKVSRVLGKICKYLGLDKIQDIRETHSGREKDYGYNYQFAKFGDSCNPFEVNRYVLLSVNFCDFLYMSNGDSWASCHTIIDGGAGGYNGEYSSGTVSYALDNDSFIFYTIDKDYDGKDYALQPKMQRVVFAYRDGVLYEGRVYPDGRDGGDQGYAAQFRNIVQELFSKVEEKNNLWTKTNDKYIYIRSLGGTAYADWSHYSDTNVTVLKEITNNNTENYVKINARPRCLYCGDIHSVENSIVCCGEGRAKCPECGDSFDEDSCDAVWVDDTVFCCERCARNAGYVWCEDISEWIYEDDAHRDHYTDEWFYRDDDMVTTEDGNEYADWENAEADNYRCDANGKWYRLDELFYDDYEGEYYRKDDFDTIYEFSGNHYKSLENAEANGEDISEYQTEEEVA